MNRSIILCIILSLPLLVLGGHHAISGPPLPGPFQPGNNLEKGGKILPTPFKPPSPGLDRHPKSLKVSPFKSIAIITYANLWDLYTQAMRIYEYAKGFGIEPKIDPRGMKGMFERWREKITSHSPTFGWKGIINEMKAKLKRQRNLYGDTDEKYPEMKQIFKKYWN